MIKCSKVFLGKMSEEWSYYRKATAAFFVGLTFYSRLFTSSPTSGCFLTIGIMFRADKDKLPLSIGCRKIDYWPLHWPMKNILRSLGHNPSSSLHGLFGPQSAPGILKYMFECLIFVLMGWIWNVMWDNWFVIQFNLIASSDERKVGIYFGGTEQKPAFFFSRSISSHPSNKYNHGSNNCLLLFVFYLVRLKKTNRKKATVRPSETIKKHQQQGPAVVLLSIYLFCCYVCWLSVLIQGVQ